MNPFIALGQDPVGFFAALGYALLMLSITLLGSVWAFRTFTTVYTHWLKNHHKDEWWGGYIPPGGDLARLCGAVFVLALSAWSVGALAWVLGGGV